MTAERNEMSDEIIDKMDDAPSDTRQFVTFWVGREVFAVDMAPVQEIIRVPDTVRLPLAPASLDGLANLRGKVLPIVSLRRMFGFDEVEHDDSTRAIVIDFGQPLGFVVDSVASVIDVEPGSIEGGDEIRATIDSDLLTGILKNVAGLPMVMVLDFERLIQREFAKIGDLGSSHGSFAAKASTATPVDDDQELLDERQLVSFVVEQQEYAIDIEAVLEIVQVPETIVHVPKSPPHVLGIMTLRDRLLPLVSLRSLFHLPAQKVDDQSRIVIVAFGSDAVGMVTDTVSEVLRVPRELVDSMPPFLAKNSDLSDISQICRLNGGKRLVSILSAENMFHHSLVKEALQTVDAMNEQQHIFDQDDVEKDDEEQVVVFRLANGEFGVPIESVQEIVRIPDELTHVPKAPYFVEGVINLRGSVLPVIDQRKRMDLPTINRSDRQRIMVFLLGGVRTGFIVDAVTEVLKIPKIYIEAAPQLSSEQAC